jgi:hypothetical protein
LHAAFSTKCSISGIVGSTLATNHDTPRSSFS